MTLRESPPDQRRIYLLAGALSAVALALLATAPWQEPTSPRLWNDVAVFALTAILSEAWHLPGAFANVSSSVVFVPLFSAVLFFSPPCPHPIPAPPLLLVQTFT